MTEPSILNERESGIGRTAALIFVLLMAAGWLLLGAVDWYLRFDRYAWQTQWWIKPARTAPAATTDAVAERPFFTSNHVAASRGGDLTALIGIRDVTRRFEQERDAFTLVVDQYGYPNQPYDPERRPDVVVVGDSFMATGRLDDMFASQLADQSELFVYNKALMGHGPFVSVLRFLDDPRFKERPPHVLVWGFAEREIGGVFFDRFAYQIRARLRDFSLVAESPKAPVQRRPSSRIQWSALAPPRLSKALPDTSIIAQAGEWGWNRLRYRLFSQLHPWVAQADGLVVDGGMLFYSYHIETLAWTAEVRDAPLVADSIAALDQLCRERGIQLIVVLIPEKEQVYRKWIPERLNPKDKPLPPSVLWALEQELDQRDVAVVNMLPVFEKATARGELVYWRDDTHWNAHGIRLAADAVANLLQNAAATLESSD